MKAIVRRFHSPDVYNLQAWTPPSPTNFAFLLQVMVGPDGMEGEESFDVEVCTPEWLAQSYGPSGIVLGRGHLIVFRYDFPAIDAFVRDFVEGCVGATWPEVAAKVARLGHWEFEDYEEYRPDVT